jgi:hypothetical protein
MSTSMSQQKHQQNTIQPDHRVKLQMDNVIKGIGSHNKAHTSENCTDNNSIFGLQNQGSKQALKAQTQQIQRSIDYINNNQRIVNSEPTTSTNLSEIMSETNSNKSISNISATPYGYERINKTNPVFKPIAAKVYNRNSTGTTTPLRRVGYSINHAKIKIFVFLFIFN